jgi:hypothetical protein
VPFCRSGPLLRSGAEQDRGDRDERQRCQQREGDDQSALSGSVCFHFFVRAIPSNSGIVSTTQCLFIYNSTLRDRIFIGRGAYLSSLSVSGESSPLLSRF